MSKTAPPSALAAIGNGFRSLLTAPFRTLAGLLVLMTVTSTSFSTQPTEIEFALQILLLVTSIYVQIALILAAGRSDPEPSADPWIRAAFRRRCFWRFFATSLVVVLGLLVGALLLVVGIFIVGALLAFAPSAAVIERRVPMDAVARSGQIAAGARVTSGIVFGLLVLLPTAAAQTAAVLGWAEAIRYLWPVALAVSEVVVVAGTIAVTKLFVALGGEPTPSFEQIPPRPPTGRG